MKFEPDYRNILKSSLNEKSERLSLYEHIISPSIMETILDIKFADFDDGNSSDVEEFFRHYCRFFKEMTYDTISFEECVTTVLPGHGAIMSNKAGPIQNRSDFEKYPWDEIPHIYWKKNEHMFDALSRNIPNGMKAIGGIGNGVFEISEDLVGLEYLAYMEIDDRGLFSDIYVKIGDVMYSIWKRFLDNYSDSFAVCRFGDDLGFKSGTLTSPAVIKNNIIPQYRRIIDLIKSYKKPFLLHTCGNIFEVMDDIIVTGINAKHSNEDVIAPFDKWIELYGERIGLFGGIDVDLLCTQKPDEITETVYRDGKRFRENAHGYALGSGNSIPDYVPVDGYLAMIEAVKKIREEEL